MIFSEEIQASLDLIARTQPVPQSFSAQYQQPQNQYNQQQNQGQYNQKQKFNNYG